jgi:dephospho-CoA kinase
MKKRIVGLTGGIASGKSTVGKIFTSFGVLVIDADQLAREVALPGSEALREIGQTFEGVVLEDGTLDRKQLSALVFTRPEAMQQLNAIMHPRIEKLAQERFGAAQDTATPYVVYEAAILVELGTYKNMDKLVVVAADAELQVRRVMKRNGLTESEARDRLSAQYPVAKKVAVADYVIKNDDDRAALIERTRVVHEKILGL